MSNLDCFHCGDNHPSSSCLLHDAGRDEPHGRDARGRAYTCEKAARLFAEMDATESAVMSPADDPAHVPDENPYLLPLLDAVPDVPPATPLADHIKAGMLRGRVRLPDEPDEVCPKCGRPRGDMDVAVVLPDVPPDPPTADLADDLADDLALDYIRAYYALVTAARALLDAMTRFGPDDSGQLWDAAQALRALVGDETPGTGDGDG